MAERFAVSRTPIREALLLLQGEGLVTFLPNRTSIVAPFSLNNSAAYFDTLLVLGRSVAMAAALAASKDGSKLRETLKTFRAAIQHNDTTQAFRVYLDLMRAFADMTQNMFLIRYFSHCLDSGMRTMILNYFPNAANSELVDLGDLLETLIAAVISGDAEQSDAAMRAVILQQVGIILRAIQPKFGDSFAIESTEVPNDSL